MGSKKNDLISVIIPIYNRDSYIRKCIDSVLEQNDVITEIIIIDDGSVDDSGIICDEYAEKYENVHVIHKTNGGLSSSRNLGLDVAKGDYIVFLDSDDFLPGDSLATLLKLQKQEDADFVLGNYSEYSDDGEYRNTFVIPNKYCNRVLSHRETCELLLFSDRTHILVVSWGKLFKREVWDGLRFPEDIPRSEDQFILEKLLGKCNKIYLTDKVVYNQVFSSESITRSVYSRKYLYPSEGIALVADYLIRKGYHDIALFKFGLGTRHLLLMNRVLHDKESQKEISRQYYLYKHLARKLFFHVSISSKMRLFLFCVNLKLYGRVREACANDSEKK